MPANVPSPSTGLVLLQNAKGGKVLGWAPEPWKLTSEQFGGYASTARTARRARTTYGGVGVVSMAGTLLLDGWSAQQAVAPMRRTLQAMASPSGARELTPPQAVLVTGCVELPSRWWVIASLEAGDETLLRASDGVLLRQNFTVTLVPPPTDDIVLTGGKRYTTRAGDTPQRIAATQLSRASRWRELRDSKGKRYRDGKKKLAVGTIVTLP